jgi:hypothetical protein
MVDGHDAGPQDLHILIVIEDITLPRSVIPINFPSWQSRARRGRFGYMCARCPRTSRHLVNLSLVLNQVVVSPSRSRADGVDINNPHESRRSNVSNSTSRSRVTSTRGTCHPRIRHWQRLPSFQPLLAAGWPSARYRSTTPPRP